ncbi:sensor histidine kinase [Actinoalloteichus hymeniacidonis]|uniref:histidine kinase n=1 Tax=Actinoalloteichus hymeniacidonis TaxID=340345 RepID=A0AAC9HMQ3_9PSEU|nr:histidine kinase [Actinoalloteichus hymeniacidonis]AOS62187.1 signal transduction histidine kinase [Actinoalloteichus hymeniacidonis]MBB5909788.1 signal transduction histidine kinase [Actinoalloteichus hymeniacidonis]
MINRRRVLESWRRLDVVVRDLPVALLLACASLMPAFHSHGTRLGGIPDRPFDALALAAVLLQCLPLAFRRRIPTGCLYLTAIGLCIDQIAGYHTLAGTGFSLAVLSAGAHIQQYRRSTALVLSVGYVLLTIVFNQLGYGEPLGEFVTFYLAVVLVWFIGVWWRRTRAAEAERRRLIAEETRTAERTRIARELHDVVTHHVTSMVVQAEAARYLTAAPDRLDQSLTSVATTGRRAITDLRHLLDVLNPDYDTEAGSPPAASLHTLVEQTRQAGQPVEFIQEGKPVEQAGSAYLVVYRVVQEALTNALKYAKGARTSVQVQHAEDEITVEIGTDDSGSRAASLGGSGRGLTGLRDRVDVLGGDFQAGQRPGGGFFVRVRIPAENPS